MYDQVILFVCVVFLKFCFRLRFYVCNEYGQFYFRLYFRLRSP